MAIFKEDAMKVFEYLLQYENYNVTAADIAEDCGLSVRQVNGILTANGSKFKDKEGNLKPLIYRTTGEQKYFTKKGLERTKEVHYIRLTEYGKKLDYWSNEE